MGHAEKRFPAAVLAGHSQLTARVVHEQALKTARVTPLSYDEAERGILSLLESNHDSRVNLNASLDKWSQPMKPGPDLGRQRTQGVAAILKSRDRNKSSKGKHPSNYTPPKKKRK